MLTRSSQADNDFERESGFILEDYLEDKDSVIKEEEEQEVDVSDHAFESYKNQIPTIEFRVI
jgi:hypothetical protein